MRNLLIGAGVALGVLMGGSIALIGSQPKSEVSGTAKIGTVQRDDIDTHEVDEVRSLVVNSQAGTVQIKIENVDRGSCRNGIELTQTISLDINVQAQTVVDSSTYNSCADRNQSTSTDTQQAGLVQTSDGIVILRTSEDASTWLNDKTFDSATSAKITQSIALPKIAMSSQDFISAHKARFDHNMARWNAGQYDDAGEAIAPSLTIAAPASVEVEKPAIEVKALAPKEVGGFEPSNLQIAMLQETKVSGATLIQPKGMKVFDPPSNLRSQPGTSNKVIHQFKTKGEPVVAIAQKGDWFLVHNPNGRIRGWIHTSQVR